MDFTQDMIDKAEENASEDGSRQRDLQAWGHRIASHWRTPRLMWSCPTVINLAPDKEVSRGLFRALRPGGRLMEETACDGD